MNNPEKTSQLRHCGEWKQMKSEILVMYMVMSASAIICYLKIVLKEMKELTILINHKISSSVDSV